MSKQTACRPLDTLEDCASILAFLAAATPFLAGLNEDAAYGLGILLNQVERNVREVRNSL